MLPPIHSPAPKEGQNPPGTQRRKTGGGAGRRIETAGNRKEKGTGAPRTPQQGPGGLKGPEIPQ